ncbi:hypothetical protein ZRA01_32940 [Zoogloea ramigera]|uniref:Uncharacterized protein n=2 Tax=Zoogloea ramigera TaxID=350 RepID=A0A4Y4CWD7_ZOORA|nr:hypothetical protein ZRA01_32940 [Zoogloea ramigera]
MNMRRTITALLLSAWAAGVVGGAPGEVPEADCERIARRLALARDEADRAKQAYDREMSQDSMTAYYRAQFELAAAKGEAAACQGAPAEGRGAANAEGR